MSMKLDYFKRKEGQIKMLLMLGNGWIQVLLMKKNCGGSWLLMGLAL